MSVPTLCSACEKWEIIHDSWKRQIQWYSDNDYFSELNRTDGQLLAFNGKIFSGFTTVAILIEIQQFVSHSNASKFVGWSVLYKVFGGEKRRNKSKSKRKREKRKREKEKMRKKEKRREGGGKERERAAAPRTFSLPPHHTWRAYHSRWNLQYL